ncbi:hypothetical protein RNAN_2243 [Rheinheimera nanhaiensis E407-8]|uniref:Uncharacterized protein n=1 Tax=Rheinheimera nanhaiensis E407-8 TaxID=562729 RepID=I1DYX3_9GAMM|nr:hypothetical protein RNAN_2243 [Rheinheimera nanhaiensis E407-8]
MLTVAGGQRGGNRLLWLQCSLRKGKVAADNKQNKPVQGNTLRKTGSAVKPLY